jgi:hypothetical protein
MKRIYPVNEIGAIERLADKSVTKIETKEGIIRSVNADGSLRVQILGSTSLVDVQATKSQDITAGQTISIRRSQINGRWVAQTGYTASGGLLIVNNGDTNIADLTSDPPVDIVAYGNIGFLFCQWQPNTSDTVDYYEIQISDTAPVGDIPGSGAVIYRTNGSTYIINSSPNESIKKYFRVRTINTSGAVSAWTGYVSAQSLIDTASKLYNYTVQVAENADQSLSSSANIDFDTIIIDDYNTTNVIPFYFEAPFTATYTLHTFGNLGVIISGTYKFSFDIVKYSDSALIATIFSQTVTTTPGGNLSLLYDTVISLTKGEKIALRINITPIVSGSITATISGTGLIIQWTAPRIIKYYQEILVPNGASEINLENCLTGDVLHAIYLQCQSAFDLSDSISIGTTDNPDLIAVDADFDISITDKHFLPINYRFSADTILKMFISNSGSNKIINIGIDIK